SRSVAGGQGRRSIWSASPAASRRRCSRRRPGKADRSGPPTARRFPSLRCATARATSGRSVRRGASRSVTNEKSAKHGVRWSPDGQWIAYISNRDKTQDIYIVSAAGGEPRKLTSKTNEWDENRWAPTWSPDGKHIAFVSNRSDYFADDLWMVDVDGSHLTRLTTNVRVMTDPLWSPDGRYIAFNAVRNWEFWFDDMSDFYLVKMPERKVSKLATDGYATDLNGNIHMYWSPDSKSLFYRYNTRGDTNIWSVNVEGNLVATQVTNGQGVIQSMSVSPKGDGIAFVRATQTGPGELTWMPMNGGEERQLTHWATRFDGVAAPAKISFLSKDGMYINGYLYKPAGLDPAKKYPGLISVHGG